MLFYLKQGEHSFISHFVVKMNNHKLLKFLFCLILAAPRLTYLTSPSAHFQNSFFCFTKVCRLIPLPFCGKSL